MLNNEWAAIIITQLRRYSSQNLCVLVLATQSVVHMPVNITILWCYLERQNLRLHLRPTESESAFEQGPWGCHAGLSFPTTQAFVPNLEPVLLAGSPPCCFHFLIKVNFTSITGTLPSYGPKLLGQQVPHSGPQSCLQHLGSAGLLPLGVVPKAVGTHQLQWLSTWKVVIQTEMTQSAKYICCL